jgi:hypothetical protein
MTFAANTLTGKGPGWPGNHALITLPGTPITASGAYRIRGPHGTSIVSSQRPYGSPASTYGVPPMRHPQSVRQPTCSAGSVMEPQGAGWVRAG